MAGASGPASGPVLVYLDVDGVLNTSNSTESRQKLDDQLLANLRHVLDSVPGAQLVLSSTWRLLEPFRALLDKQLVAAGIAVPIAQTGHRRLTIPRQMGPERGAQEKAAAEQWASLQRVLEIRASVLELAPSAWIAIDDLPMTVPNPAATTAAGPYKRLRPLDDSAVRPIAGAGASALDEATCPMLDDRHFVKTEEESGLTAACAAAAIQRLMQQLRDAGHGTVAAEHAEGPSAADVAEGFGLLCGMGDFDDVAAESEPEDDDASEEGEALVLDVLDALGMPWYAEMLREAAGSSLLEHRTAQQPGFRAALVEAGVTEPHAKAIADSVRAQPRRRMHATKPGAKTAAQDVRVDESPFRTRGGLYSEAFLDAVRALYDQHMGAENLGPWLYTLVRFFKPLDVLEVGAGYTSIFLLQALADNAAELELYSQLRAERNCELDGMPWSNDQHFAPAQRSGTLHAIDNFAHESTTAHVVMETAKRIGLDGFLKVHNTDAFDVDLPSTLEPHTSFGLLWIDLGAGPRLERFFEAWWPRVSPHGGIAAVHSTVTNSITREWLERMRRKCHRIPGEEHYDPTYGRIESVSLVEPMKMFQNSVSILDHK